MATLFKERSKAVEAQSIDPALMDDVALKAVVRLLQAWEVDNPSSATLVGVKERTWARMKSRIWAGGLSQDQRMRVSGLVGLYQALHVYFGEQLANRWVHMPNEGALFQGRSPLQQMLDGGLPAILATRNYVDAIRGGL